MSGPLRCLGLLQRDTATQARLALQQGQATPSERYAARVRRFFP